MTLAMRYQFEQVVYAHLLHLLLLPIGQRQNSTPQSVTTKSLTSVGFGKVITDAIDALSAEN